MSRQELIGKVDEYSQRYHLLEQDDRVITGISGGPDSVCLFLVLLELSKSIGFEIVAVHVNHGLRGEDADADAGFVRELCNRWSVPCYVFEEDVSQLAKAEKLSLEEAGRDVRRRCFEEVREKCGGTKIALAHHMDDNAETLIMNLCRGSGLRGLGGMRPRNGMVVRPLLCLRRAEIEQFLCEAKQAWREDQSNVQDHYTRNRIRNHVLPYLTDEVNSGAVEHMNTTMEQMRELEEYLAKQTEIMYQKWTRGFEAEENLNAREVLLLNQAYTEVPKVIRNRMILKCMGLVSGKERDISAVHVEQADGLFTNQSGKQLSLPHGIAAFREYDGIRFTRRTENAPFPAQRIGMDINDSVLLNIPGDSRWLEGQFAFRCKVFDNTGAFPEEDCGNKSTGFPYTEWFNYDIIKAYAALIRRRRAGDYMVIDRRGHKKKLKALLIDAKVPAARRNQIPVLALGKEILWIPGVRRSSAYLVTEETRQILQIECTEDK